MRIMPRSFSVTEKESKTKQKTVEEVCLGQTKFKTIK